MKTWTLKIKTNGEVKTVTVKALKADVERLERRLHEVLNIKSYWREITGTHGNHDEKDYMNRESISILYSPFTEPKDAEIRDPEGYKMKVAELMKALTAETITTDKIPAYITACKDYFNLHVPEIDKRKTPDERTAENAEHTRLIAEREAENKKKAEADHHEAERLIKAYPHLIPTDKSGKTAHANGAANIKRELEKFFPGIDFSVKSESYSGGDSIHIKWTDGPLEKEVKPITGKYQEGYYDGMIDMYEYIPSVFTGTYGGAKHVFTNREYSIATIQAAIDSIWEEYKANIEKHNNPIPEKSTPEIYQNGDTRHIKIFDNQNGHDYLDTAINAYLHDYRPELPEPTPPPEPDGTTPAGSNNGNITLTYNKEKNGIELKFRSRPSEEILDTLKANRFRWSKFQKIWYARQTPQAIKTAERIAGKATETPTAETSTPEQQEETAPRTITEPQMEPAEPTEAEIKALTQEIAKLYSMKQSEHETNAYFLTDHAEPLTWLKLRAGTTGYKWLIITAWSKASEQGGTFGNRKTFTERQPLINYLDERIKTLNFKPEPPTAPEPTVEPIEPIEETYSKETQTAAGLDTTPPSQDTDQKTGEPETAPTKQEAEPIGNIASTSHSQLSVTQQISLF